MMTVYQAPLLLMIYITSLTVHSRTNGGSVGLPQGTVKWQRVRYLHSTKYRSDKLPGKIVNNDDIICKSNQNSN